MYLQGLYVKTLSRAACVTVGVRFCVCVCVCVSACIDLLCRALFGQESSASFSVPHQSYHTCNEVEKFLLLCPKRKKEVPRY